MFPKFLLPPTIFHHNKRNVGYGSPSRLPIEDTRMKDRKYLNGHISYIRCLSCATDLCLTSQIISKGFTGRHGRAYLVSAEPVATAVSVNASSSPTESLPNTLIQSPVSRQLVTGAHTVSDINCAFCGTVLGWKYVSAEEESQRYKVGKFILETKRIITSSSWESTSGGDLTIITDPQRSSNMDLKSLDDDMEFDSQDEDECEDLFAGIWSPGLAMRRRSRKLDRHPSIFGPSSS